MILTEADTTDLKCSVIFTVCQNTSWFVIHNDFRFLDSRMRACLHTICILYVHYANNVKRKKHWPKLHRQALNKQMKCDCVW